jgi:hypothetical protein
VGKLAEIVVGGGDWGPTVHEPAGDVAAVPELDVPRDVVAVAGALVVAGRCVVAMWVVVVVAVTVVVVADAPPVDVDDEGTCSVAVVDDSLEELEAAVEAVVDEAAFDLLLPHAATRSAAARAAMCSRRDVIIESLVAAGSKSVAPRSNSLQWPPDSGCHCSEKRSSLNARLEGWQSGRMHPP